MRAVGGHRHQRVVDGVGVEEPVGVPVVGRRVEAVDLGDGPDGQRPAAHRRGRRRRRAWTRWPWWSSVDPDPDEQPASSGGGTGPEGHRPSGGHAPGQEGTTTQFIAKRHRSPPSLSPCPLAQNCCSQDGCTLPQVRPVVGARYRQWRARVHGCPRVRGRVRGPTPSALLGTMPPMDVAPPSASVVDSEAVTAAARTGSGGRRPVGPIGDAPPVDSSAATRPSAAVPAPPGGSGPDDPEGPPFSRVTTVAIVVVTVLVLAVSLVLRFWTRSDLWLDEALTVNIARLPLHEIPSFLRRDGSPPLYYVLLHFWMGWFGTSDVAVRSLSGVFGVITLPLVWLAGRRLGGDPAGLDRPPAAGHLAVRRPLRHRDPDVLAGGPAHRARLPGPRPVAPAARARAT